MLELKLNGMNLQKEIKQSSFKSEYQKGLINIIYTYNWACTHLKDFLKPYGITMQQFNVLRILNGQKKPISTNEIRSRMLDRMSDVSRIVERLHKKGFVKRSESTKQNSSKTNSAFLIVAVKINPDRKCQQNHLMI